MLSPQPKPNLFCGESANYSRGLPPPHECVIAPNGFLEVQLLIHPLTSATIVLTLIPQVQVPYIDRTWARSSHNDARSSPSPVLTIKLHIFSVKYLWLSVIPNHTSLHDIIQSSHWDRAKFRGDLSVNYAYAIFYNLPLFACKLGPFLENKNEDLGNFWAVGKNTNIMYAVWNSNIT